MAPIFQDKDDTRLKSDKIIWFSSINPNNTPHIAPVWFVLFQNKLFVCTGSSSIKARNIKKNANIVCALEDGVDPLIIEGQSIFYDSKSASSDVIRLFKEKYDWDIMTDVEYDMIVEILPKKVLMRRKK